MSRPSTSKSEAPRRTLWASVVRGLWRSAVALLPAIDEARDGDVDTYARQLTVRVAQVLAVVVAFGALLIWPTDLLVFRDDPAAIRAFVALRLSTVAATIVAVLIAGWIYRRAISLYWLVAVMMVLGFVVMPYAHFGRWLADPTQSHYYVIYAIAPLTILLMLPLWLRVLTTAAIIYTWIAIPVLFFPELERREATVAALVFASFVGACSVLVGHGFSLLVRRSYQRELELRAERRRVAAVNHQLAEVFANVSHEMRTPLTVIRANLERLNALVDDESSARWFEGLDRNVARLSILVDQFLSISRGGGDALQPRARALDLEAALRSVVGAVYAEPPTSSQLRWVLPEAPVYAQVDAAHFADMAFNLVSNARKFAVAARGEDAIVEIELRDDGAQVQLLVRDNGPGISEALAPKVFARFTQADTDSRLQLGGAGLGLAIVHELARLNGGHATLGSPHAYGGAELVLTLPAGEAPAAAEPALPSARTRAQDAQLQRYAAARRRAGTSARPDDAAAPGQGPDIDRPVIFVVDDEEDMREHFVDALRGEDAEVFAFASAAQLLEAMASVTPSLIVSDLMMRPMDGAALVAVLRQEEAWQHVPVIIVSADHDVGSRVAVLERGAVDFLTKPFHEPELLARVRRHLELARWAQLMADTVARLESARAGLEGLADGDAVGDFSEELAQVLHDDLGQLIAACNVELTLAEFESSMPMAAASLGRMRQAIGALSVAFRETLEALSARNLPGDWEAGAWRALALARRYLTVDVQEGLFEDIAALAPRARDLLFRALRELFTNVLRHSSASTVWVALDSLADDVVLKVRDDGVGMTDDARRAWAEEAEASPVDAGTAMGLRGIRSRAREAGGDVRVESEGGLTVHVRIPKGPSGRTRDAIMAGAQRDGWGRYAE